MNKLETLSITEVQLRSFIAAKRPKDEDIRRKLDYGYSWNGQTAILFEIRPQWNDLTNILELPFAKLRFVKSSKLWKLYWMRASGKWELYEPHPIADNLQDLLAIIKEDQFHCFFG